MTLRFSPDKRFKNADSVQHARGPNGEHCIVWRGIGKTRFLATVNGASLFVSIGRRSAYFPSREAAEQACLAACSRQ